MAVVVKNFEKFSISLFLKRNIKLLIHKSVPNLFIKWLDNGSVTLSGDTERVFEGFVGE